LHYAKAIIKCKGKNEMKKIIHDLNEEIEDLELRAVLFGTDNTQRLNALKNLREKLKSSKDVSDADLSLLYIEEPKEDKIPF
jgi:Rad3-related DNA helicase